MGDLQSSLIKLVLRRLAAAVGSVALVVLGGLSILGAFLGAGGAGWMFSTWPAACFWVLLAVLVAAALALARTRRDGPWIALAHLGGLLVLLGGLIGSDKAHGLAGSLLGVEKVPGGYLAIGRGEQSDVLLERNLTTQAGRLPFALRLRQLRVEHYPPKDDRWVLVVRATEYRGQPLETPPQVLTWEPGQAINLPFCDATLTVLDYVPFSRYRPPEKVADSLHPAMRVELRRGEVRREVWLLPTEDDPQAGVSVTQTLGLDGEVGVHLLPPPRRVKDYASHVEVLDGGRVVAAGEIRVNHPLHYGGYHLYQYACDEEGGQFTILAAVSDWGLIPSAVGGVLLCAGALGACWVYPAWMRLSERKSIGGQV